MGFQPSHMPMPTDNEVNQFLGSPQPQAGGDSFPGMPSSGEVDQYLGNQQNEDRFGGVAGGVLSTAAGAADSATLGLSNYAMTKSGMVKPETLKALQDVNPGLYTAGQIGGLFTPGGAAEIIGKAGKATYTGIKALKAIQEAEKIGTITKGLINIGAVGAGSAVEGAAFAGVGNSLNEAALGDPDLNAEKVMSNFGYGALYGGAMGAALKGLSIGAPPALKAGTDALSDLKKTVMGAGQGEESLISKGLDFVDSSGKLSDAFMNRAKNLDVDQQQELVKNTTNGLNTVKNNFSTAIKDLNSVLRPAERDALIETANGPKIKIATQDVIDEINRNIEVMKQNPGEFSTDGASKLERWRLQLVNNLKDQSPGGRFDLLKDIKQGLSDWGHGFQSETKASTQQAMKDLGSFINERLTNPDIFGMAGSSEAAHNDLLSEIYSYQNPKGNARTPLQKEFKKLFIGADGGFDPKKIKGMLSKIGPEGDRARDLLDKWFDTHEKITEHFENTYANVPNDLWDKAKLDGVMDNALKTKGDVGLAQTQYEEAIKNAKGKKLGLRDIMLGGIGASHPLIGGVGYISDVMSRPLEYINKLAELERMAGKASDSIANGAKSIFTPSLKAMGKAKGLTAKELATPSSDQHMKMKADLSQLNNNPAHLIDKLSDSTKHLMAFAPQTGQGLQATMLRANQFLQSKLPPTQPQTPFAKPMEPSSFEIAHFNNYKQVVENPLLAFDQVRNGTIGPQTLETLNVVYPKLYQEMKTQMMTAISDRVASNQDVPYSLKQSASTFFGQPLDASLQPQSILANQMAFSPPQTGPQGMSPSKPGMGKITLADRTGVQAARDKA